MTKNMQKRGGGILDIKLNDKSFLSGGVQGGINQKSIRADELRFDNQYDGSGHNKGLNSNENLSNLSELKPSFSGGVSYIWSNSLRKSNVGKADGAKKMKFGFALHHFNSPSFSFSNNEKLGLKYISSFEGSFGSRSTPWTIQPVVLVGLQNKATDIVVGSLFKYLLVDGSRITDFRKSTSIGLGAYYRFKDAIIPTVQIEFASFEMGISYDVNLSQLSTSSNGRGGFELNLKYTSEQSTFSRKSTARFF